MEQVGDDMPKEIRHDPLALFGGYMKAAGVPSLGPEPAEDPSLYGKKLGLLNGSAWIQLWSYYFGRLHLPGVKLVCAGNDAVQLNFMRAHESGAACPPARNIDLFARYARDLVELAGVDAILITCSTMNRSLPRVAEYVSEFGVPVLQIDRPMMEKAVAIGGRVLIVATHGPTVASTRRLLEETAAETGRPLAYTGVTVEDAFVLLGEGRIEEHNRVIAKAIEESLDRQQVDQVVLAQLSMSVFSLSYPDPQKRFGVPVLTSGEEGFKRMGEILRNLSPGPFPSGEVGK